MNHYSTNYQTSAYEASAVSSRAEFIMKTYHHLVGAILLFAGLQMVYFKTGVADLIMRIITAVPWLLIIGAFMVVAWMATHVSHTATSKGSQYAALIGFVVAESIIFVPLLYMVINFAGASVLSHAVWATLFGFGALTGVAFVTRKDFSFLRSFLMFGGFIALGLIVVAFFSGLHLGVWFAWGMVFFSGAAILYDTSNIIHHYPEDRYVGASLSLFASVAMMFWYVLQLLSNRD